MPCAPRSPPASHREPTARSFNVGSDAENTILELAEQLIAVTGSRSRVEFVPQSTVYGTSYEDISRRVPDVTKMHQVLGVRAETPLAEGLRRTVAWFQDAGTGRGARRAP